MAGKVPRNAPGRRAALLRGVNVGKAKRISMADLRSLVEGLGFGEVGTLLNSGNVVFSAAGTDLALALAIEQALAARTGIQSRVTVLDAADLDALVAENPLPARFQDPARLLAAFTRDAADHRRLEELAGRDWETEAMALGQRAGFLWCPEGTLSSPLWAAVNRTGVTSRNWATVLKLQALVRGSG